jgi:hypothetical protein
MSKEGRGEPFKDVKKATSGRIAMVEFVDGTYAIATLALAGEIEMNGRQLEIRRASGYIVQPPEENERLSSDTVSKTGVSESKVVLRLTNLRELHSHNSKIQR